jgi:hypothetical protein
MRKYLTSAASAVTFVLSVLLIPSYVKTPFVLVPRTSFNEHAFENTVLAWRTVSARVSIAIVHASMAAVDLMSALYDADVNVNGLLYAVVLLGLGSFTVDSILSIVVLLLFVDSPVCEHRFAALCVLALCSCARLHRGSQAADVSVACVFVLYQLLVLLYAHHKTVFYSAQRLSVGVAVISSLSLHDAAADADMSRNLLYIAITIPFSLACISIIDDVEKNKSAARKQQVASSSPIPVAPAASGTKQRRASKKSNGITFTV